MRGHSAKRPSFRPDDTTPYTRNTRGRGVFSRIGWIAVLASGAWLAVSIYGLPALRFEYTYTGTKEARFDQVCWYLTIDGLQRIVPPPGLNQCSLIRFFPLR